MKFGKLNHIVAAVDISLPCGTTAIVAHRLARATKSRLTLAYVSERGAETPRSSAASCVQEQTESETERLERFREWLSSGSETLGIRTVILEGPIAAEIITFAAENEADLVVVGGPNAATTKDGGHLGIVARRLARDSTCPVLVTPELGQFDGQFRSAIVGFDYSLFALPAAILASCLVRDCGSVEHLQVLSSPLGATDSNTGAGRSEFTSEDVARETERLREYTTAHVLGGPSHVPHVEVGAPTGTLLEQTRCSGADLVVVGAHQWQSLGDRLYKSTTDHVRHVPAVLVVTRASLGAMGPSPI